MRGLPYSVSSVDGGSGMRMQAVPQCRSSTPSRLPAGIQFRRACYALSGVAAAHICAPAVLTCELLKLSGSPGIAFNCLAPPTVRGL